MDGIYFDVKKAADPVKSDAHGSSALGKDEFLKLMMAQLAQQDPTAPSDSNAFVAQLAQFSSLEQMQNVNTSLQSLLIGQASQNNSGAINLVGKDVLYKTDEMTLEEGQKSASTSVKLAGEATEITATITDEQGRVVRTLKLGGHKEGDLEIEWDGREESGNTAKPGKYKVSVTAKDSRGNLVDVEQRAHGRVTGVSFEKGYPEAILGDQRLKMSDIVEINERNTP
ncbi:MAG TPA: flagellar hook capping FlgD N-terminal domain-containing protein [Polyangia bacterium]|nr:flagellar hook capping FlgD N-terminal domain-containing protein [Polyangia bacterium]